MKMTMTWMVALTALVSLADPYTGLWVGSVSLHAVNEVSIPLDKNNVPVAPDPTKPTVTGDRADFTLILHVNEAGQVSLLKDVAIVNRNPSGDLTLPIADIVAAGSDEGSLSLVTDPTLYAEYPMQKAMRLASVVFDFGDAKATSVLDDLVDKLVALAKLKTEVASDNEIATSALRNLLLEEALAEMAMEDWYEEETTSADVAASYAAFLDSVRESIPDIAASPALTTGAAFTFYKAATDLRDASVFQDTRAMDLVRAVQAAGTARMG